MHPLGVVQKKERQYKMKKKLHAAVSFVLVAMLLVGLFLNPQIAFANPDWHGSTDPHPTCEGWSVTVNTNWGGYVGYIIESTNLSGSWTTNQVGVDWYVLIGWDWVDENGVSHHEEWDDSGYIARPPCPTDTAVPTATTEPTATAVPTNTPTLEPTPTTEPTEAPAKMRICHRIGESAPWGWQAIEIAIAAWPSHQQHGDFEWEGPEEDWGEPGNGGITPADQWCLDNQPTDPTPTPLPTATPIPDPEWEFEWSYEVNCVQPWLRVNNLNSETVWVEGEILANDILVARVPPQYSECPPGGWCGPEGDMPANFFGIVTMWVEVSYGGEIVAEKRISEVLNCTQPQAPTATPTEPSETPPTPTPGTGPTNTPTPTTIVPPPGRTPPPDGVIVDSGADPEDYDENAMMWNIGIWAVILCTIGAIWIAIHNRSRRRN
ncbi:hypothetical protein A2397_05840 [Candidatus Amesbacteria bacterium RIFOXYB1_FULL_44_23]|uniref:Uncharacterized protein n=1 Tax=Candidatus Amesbacteria bacterium RIFOXYB1_FULL_44_23 TaxID=1797263 RepID=A0A1F4ZU45_9BACT|nr:MAG: hypothetical protein A2397_05840 [Candidatus Amesbacteria bacterium RIFOXYB1_FULL_44_23]